MKTKMDKTQAETFVRNSAGATSRRKWFIAAVSLCGLFLIPCFAIYHGTIYTVIAVIMLLSAIVIGAIGGSKKISEFVFSVLAASIFLIICTILNLIIYGISIIIDCFVWWIYMILIFFEIVAFIGTLFTNKYLVKSVLNKKGDGFRVSIAVSAGMLGHAIGSILMHFFHPSDNTLGFIFVSLICICVCLFEIPVTLIMYRAYLIKKFDIKIDKNTPQTDTIDNQ